MRFKSGADGNYYRDIFLLWPFLLFSFAAAFHFPSGRARSEGLYFYELTACAIASLLLAKEKCFLLLGSLGFIAVRLGLALFLKGGWNWNAILWFAILVALLLVVGRTLVTRNWQPSYEIPEGTDVLELLLGLGGLGLAILAIIALEPH